MNCSSAGMPVRQMQVMQPAANVNQSGGCGGWRPEPPQTGGCGGGQVDTSDPGKNNDWNVGSPTEAQGAGDPSYLSAEAQSLLDAINRERVSRGLSELKLSTRLTEAAEANDALQRTRGLGHHIDLGTYGSDGEIAATGGNLSPEQAVQMWLHSPGHKAILLDRNQTHVGVSIGGGVATADFV